MSYFDYLPVELSAIIASKLGTEDLDNLCGIIQCKDNFWINLVKRVYPFPYKREYDWRSLYHNILMIDEDIDISDLYPLAGFYIYEGLDLPSEIHYAEALVIHNDIPALSKITNYYQDHPEVISQKCMGESFYDWVI